jgi:PTS system mannose-specific IIA component
MDPDRFGILVVTHGGLGESLVRATGFILGDVPQRLLSYSMDWEDDVDQTRQGLRQCIQELGTEEGVLVLTDMFGGTPTNVSLSLLKEERVEVVCGVNLPMVLKALGLREVEDLAEAAHKVAEGGREGVCVAAEFLRGED